MRRAFTTPTQEPATCSVHSGRPMDAPLPTQLTRNELPDAPVCFIHSLYFLYLFNKTSMLKSLFSQQSHRLRQPLLATLRATVTQRGRVRYPPIWSEQRPLEESSPVAHSLSDSEESSSSKSMDSFHLFIETWPHGFRGRLEFCISFMKPSN